MGGIGSGNWRRFDKKSTVEESLTLTMRIFRSLLSSQSSGVITWGDSNSSIGYRVTWGDSPRITLLYRFRDCEDIEVPIRLQSTPTNFKGKRWWFTCPLLVNGLACNLRADKLHLPPRTRFFGCRKCHELTYRSCQDAHKYDRLFGRIEKMGQFQRADLQ